MNTLVKILLEITLFPQKFKFNVSSYTVLKLISRPSHVIIQSRMFKIDLLALILFSFGRAAKKIKSIGNLTQRGLDFFFG